MKEQATGSRRVSEMETNDWNLNLYNALVATVNWARSIFWYTDHGWICKYDCERRRKKKHCPTIKTHKRQNRYVCTLFVYDVSFLSHTLILKTYSSNQRPTLHRAANDSSLKELKYSNNPLLAKWLFMQSFDRIRLRIFLSSSFRFDLISWAQQHRSSIETKTK